MNPTEELIAIAEICRANATCKVMAEGPDAGVARNVYRENATGFDWTRAATALETAQRTIAEKDERAERAEHAQYLHGIEVNDALITAEARVAELEAALERYGSESFWHEYGHPCPWPGNNPVDHTQSDCDEGALARQALAKERTDDE